MTDLNAKLETPSRLTVQFVANLAGVAVNVSAGANQRDPLGQCGTSGHYANFSDAVAGIRELIDDEMLRLAGRGAER